MTTTTRLRTASWWVAFSFSTRSTQIMSVSERSSDAPETRTCLVLSWLWVSGCRLGSRRVPPKSRIHVRATRKRSLAEAQANANHNRSKIRARVEHVFAAQQTAMGGRVVRTIGIVRARAKIGLQNLAYNIRRLVTLERIAAA